MAPAREQDRAALRRRIGAAFADRPYPGDGDLGINTPNCDWYEGEVVARFFRGRDWRALTFDDLLHADERPLGSIPSFMTVAAFAYYLPAFLIMALEVDPADRTDRQAHLDTFAGSICFRLAPPMTFAQQYDMVKDWPFFPEEQKALLRDPTPEAKAAERRIADDHAALIATLTPVERAAVCAALEFLADHFDGQVPDAEFNDARKALDGGWAAFLD
jgi:hypothetical protein